MDVSLMGRGAACHAAAVNINYLELLATFLAPDPLDQEGQIRLYFPDLNRGVDLMVVVQT